MTGRETHFAANLLHTEVILQPRDLHDTAHQMQTPSYKHLAFAQLFDNLHGVLDRWDCVHLVFCKRRVELQPCVAQGILSGQLR